MKRDDEDYVSVGEAYGKLLDALSLLADVVLDAARPVCEKAIEFLTVRRHDGRWS